MKNNRTAEIDLIERYIPSEFRRHIEKEFYGRITEKARFENLINDEEFRDDPVDHVGLFTDHGIVHVRNVAFQVHSLLDRINGVLIPERERGRLEFMKGFGILTAYMHDIGMINFSYLGRKMHPEFASQYLFEESFDQYADLIWEENSSNVAWKILNLRTSGKITGGPKVILREMLALAVCHSKSKIDISLLNDLSSLRKRMQQIILTSLDYLFLIQQLEKVDSLPAPDRIEKRSELEKEINYFQGEKGFPSAARFYGDLSEEAWNWMICDDAEVRELTLDIIDTVRALRCADALRQRGSVLKTSGGYEIFSSEDTANAIYALRNNDNSKLYLLEADVPLNAGEANISSSEIDWDCDLRISFHRGSFASAEATERAAYNAAVTINDIQADVISAFIRKEPKGEDQVKRASQIEILLEGAEDNSDFADLVRGQLEFFLKDKQVKVKSVSSLHKADIREVERYLAGEKYDIIKENTGRILKNLKKAGFKTDKIDIDNAFTDVTIIKLLAGDILLKAGSVPAFVYIPLGKGLRVIRTGGYLTVPSPAWIPIGNTGAIRGAARNADVVTKKDIRLLAIPKKIYLDYWNSTYSAGEFIDEITGDIPKGEDE